MILLKLSQLGCLLNSIVQATQLVNQLDAKGIAGQPYTALTYLVNLLGLKTTTLGYYIQEILITTIDVVLHLAHNLLGILTCYQLGFVTGKLVGLHTIEGNAQLIGNQTAEVRNQAEDTNTTSDSGRLGNDIVGR